MNTRKMTKSAYICQLDSDSSRNTQKLATRPSSFWSLGCKTKLLGTNAIPRALWNGEFVVKVSLLSSFDVPETGFM